jgi:hypothetical protein
MSQILLIVDVHLPVISLGVSCFDRVKYDLA